MSIIACVKYAVAVYGWGLARGCGGAFVAIQA